MTDDIHSEFLSRGIIHHRALLLPPDAALEFVRECSKRGIALLGYDAFRLLPNNVIQPIMDDSLNLTAEPYFHLTQGEGWALAEHLIEERLGRDIVFEMAID
jgi:hypothetical protein